jgi:uncharacterized protein (UPF0261 family)
MADSSSSIPREVVLVGTLDTKGREYAFVRERLLEAGVRPIVIDVGVLDEPPFQPDIGADDVARAAGTTLAELRFEREGSDTRAVALAAMERGAVAFVRKLHAAGRCSGILGLGGSGGSTVISGAMRALPVGVPKLLVSTMASGNVRLFVGTSDICLMYSVTDIAGLHRVSRRILTNAANALAGMVLGEQAPADGRAAPLVALTMFGVTTPAVLRVQQRLEEEGFETIVFHAVGSGGGAMEQMIDDGLIDGVVDLTTSELTDELLGGIFSAGPGRLEAAGRRGIPQVIVPGALEVLNFGPRDSVPDKYDVPERRIVVHNPSVCAVRTNAQEAAQLGRLLAEKASRAKGPVAVLLPLDGLSNYEAHDGPFVDRQADEALFEAIRRSLRPDIPVREIKANINDRQFADAATETFLELWRAAQ